MKYYYRKLQQDIYPWLDKPDIIVILGARQVGKSSLLNLLAEDIKRKLDDSRNIMIFNLEDSETLSALNRNPKYFKEYLMFAGANPQKPSIVMIDEIQYLDDPSHFLKYIADMEPSIKLIITGSTSIKIKKFKDGLTGRKKVFYLFPLNFWEFLLFKNRENLHPVVEEFTLKNIITNRIAVDIQRIIPFKDGLEGLFEEYILYGGYPKVVLARAREEKLQELKELFETYELKDVNILFNVENVKGFRNLFKLLSGNIGGLLNVNEIANNLGMGRDTVRRYLGVLENSFIIHLLPPFHTNIRKELIRMPKIFFMDTGLRNFAVRNFTEINFRPDRGGLFENAIFVELYKNLGIIDQLFFWRTLSRNEVDFILTSEDKIAIEAKCSYDNQLRIPAGLKAFGKIYPEFESVVVTLTQFACKEKTIYLSAWMV
ncbi:MAG: ATP-binding protein [Nitrospirota bacterium]